MIPYKSVMSRRGKFIETESRFVVARSQGGDQTNGVGVRAMFGVVNMF